MLWLSHHYPEDYDRCRVVAGRHVCRRCAVLYPVAAIAMVAALVGWWWPDGWGPLLLAVLPLPAVVEFVGEHLGWLRYRPRRQALVTVPLGLALGAGLARYLEDQTDPVFWAMVLGYGGVCLAAAVLAWRRPRGHDAPSGSEASGDCRAAPPG